MSRRRCPLISVASSDVQRSSQFFVGSVTVAVLATKAISEVKDFTLNWAADPGTDTINSSAWTVSSSAQSMELKGRDNHHCIGFTGKESRTDGECVGEKGVKLG
jgi:hypothetical protein